jgi:hypothetical protein
MKTFSLFLATLVLASAAAAQSYYVAFSVAGVKQLGDNVYTVTVSTEKNPGSPAPVPNSGDVLTLGTEDCTHVPAAGETGILMIEIDGARRTSEGRYFHVASSRLLFSSGATCSVTAMQTGTQTK